MPVQPSKSVLLVEDDALLRECLAEVLGDAGWRVVTAAGAAAALDHMEAGGVPDVLVTDLLLGPGLTGLALIAEAPRRWPGLRAVLATGADVGRLDMHPGDRFLDKPFSMDALVQAVTVLSREPAVESGFMARQP